MLATLIQRPVASSLKVALFVSSVQPFDFVAVLDQRAKSQHSLPQLSVKFAGIWHGFFDGKSHGFDATIGTDGTT